MKSRFLKIVLAGCVAFVCLGSSRPVEAQSVLERLEQKIRNQLKQPAQAPGKQSGYLGLKADDEKDRGRGVRVLQVHPDTPAEKAGFRRQDLITGVAGVRVRQLTEMADILALYSPGESLRFDILRNDRQEQLKVTLGRPAPPQQPSEKPSPAGPKLTVSETIEQLQRRIEQLERRVAELERVLAELLKKQ